MIDGAGRGAANRVTGITTPQDLLCHAKYLRVTAWRRAVLT